MDAISERRLSQVNSKLAALIRELDTGFQSQFVGDSLRVEQGMRSWEEQQVAWDKGRDASGNIINPRIVVTHAPPGHSWHQFGLAVDVCPVSLLPIPGWNPNSPRWQWIGLSAEAIGLVWGGRWPQPKTDLPHLQFTGSLPESPNDYARSSYIQGGVQSVWTAAGLYAPDHTETA